MKTIVLNIDGNEYEFAYSKNFRLLKKREDGGTEFYPFSSTAYWNPSGKRSYTKKEIMDMIKAKAPLDLPDEMHHNCDCINCRPWTS